MKKLNLNAVRRKLAGMQPDDQATVSESWLRQALAELEASRASFRSPIIVLTDKREGQTA